MTKSGRVELKRSQRLRLKRIRAHETKIFHDSLNELQISVFPAISMRLSKSSPARYFTVGFNRDLPVDVVENFIKNAVEEKLEGLKNELDGKIKTAL